MKGKGFWTLIAVPGLVLASWLVAFLLLGWSTVEATPGKGTTPSTDGVASADNPTVCRGMWISETVDSAGNKDLATSLALEPTSPYTPHISYRDDTSDHLRYATLSGTTWITEAVDFGGQYTSLALVPTHPYTPCIAYHDNGLWDLKFACKDGTAWSVLTARDGGRSGQTGTPLALEPANPYTPHIGYYYPVDGDENLRHTYLSGTVWMSGTWVEKMVEPIGSEAGTWSSLALEPTPPYTPHLSYYDKKNDDLKHAWLSGITWLSETVDSAGDVGWYTSLALDSSDNPHISYFDDTNDSLKYAWMSGTTWLSETVETIGRGPYYGSGTSLQLDQVNSPYICYYDALNDDLKLAHFDGTTWISQTVDSSGDVGAYCSLALDPLGCPHISYYDATNDKLKYAYLSPIQVYLPLVTRNYPPPYPYTYESPSLTANCSWTGVWGYVRTADGLPEANVQMRVGNWQGWRADAWTDADGKYSYMFADNPIAGEWFVQVFDYTS